MMQSKFIENNFCYDGTQLTSLFAYMNYEVLGDSIISWVGQCEISNEHMVDGEDLLLNSEIKSDKMLHFIVEKFDVNLFSAVCLQRIMSDIAISLVSELAKDTFKLERKGDDIYWNGKKFNISIATQSPSSSLIHYGVNVGNSGTPVETCALSDFGIQEVEFSKLFMQRFCQEVESITRATQKVKWVK